jgi:hypothetical protein
LTGQPVSVSLSERSDLSSQTFFPHREYEPVHA